MLQKLRTPQIVVRTPLEAVILNLFEGINEVIDAVNPLISEHKKQAPLEHALELVKSAGYTVSERKK